MEIGNLSDKCGRSSLHEKLKNDLDELNENACCRTERICSDENGEFTHLKGLIYFTDGFGTYPETPPPYETAFVFVEEDGKMRTVPPWAMKVVIDQDQILTH